MPAPLQDSSTRSVGLRTGTRKKEREFNNRIIAGLQDEQN
jgi:hypothetical protein